MNGKEIMKKLTKAWIGILLTISQTATARLGETPEQAKERYGNPQSEIRLTEEITTAQYEEKAGISVSCTFLRNRVFMIKYESSLEQGIFEGPEIIRLWKINTGLEKWTITGEKNGNKFFQAEHYEMGLVEGGRSVLVVTDKFSTKPVGKEKKGLPEK